LKSAISKSCLAHARRSRNDRTLARSSKLFSLAEGPVPSEAERFLFGCEKHRNLIYQVDLTSA
jgi:hypothetical protein